MKLEEITEIYDLISRGGEHIVTRNHTRSIRKKAFSSLTNGLTKLAFDTRRIDQENTYIPRRGLQNYHRSEQFISDAMHEKIQGFNKLNKVLEQLKKDLGKEPEWQDSYTRVLSAAVQRGLRLEQLDNDFSDTQPSMASLAYLEELLYVRYRLTPNDLFAMSEDKLREALLKKDEVLLRKNSTVSDMSAITGRQMEIMPSDVTKYSYEEMMQKFLFSMAQMMQEHKKAIPYPSPPVHNTNETVIDNKLNINKSNDNNDRTITITIKG